MKNSKPVEQRRYRLRPVRDAEMEMIYRWRNHPRVRQVMPYSEAIDFETHQRWWPGAMADPSRRTMILEDSGMPVAVVVFFELRRGVTAEWGCYTAPTSEITRAKSLRAWVTCQIAAVAYAFEVLRLETLYCQIIQTHTPMLRLIDRVGFEKVGEEILAQDKPPFVMWQFTQAEYRNEHRPCSLFARLDGLTIDPDRRDSSLAAYQCRQSRHRLNTAPR